MSLVHTIRLGPPWEVASLGEALTQHSRKFGRPRTLDPGDRLWIVFAELPCEAEFSLNGASMESTNKGTAEFDITEWIKIRNEIVVELSAMPESPLGDVRLEIRRTE